MGASLGNLASPLSAEELTEWHHFALTFNSSSGRIAVYVDGERTRERSSDYGFASSWLELDAYLSLGATCFHPTTQEEGRSRCFPDRFSVAQRSKYDRYSEREVTVDQVCLV